MINGCNEKASAQGLICPLLEDMFLMFLIAAMVDRAKAQCCPQLLEYKDGVSPVRSELD